MHVRIGQGQARPPVFELGTMKACKEGKIERDWRESVHLESCYSWAPGLQLRLSRLPPIASSSNWRTRLACRDIASCPAATLEAASRARVGAVQWHYSSQMLHPSLHSVETMAEVVREVF
jgi:hypothetical protein